MVKTLGFTKRLKMEISEKLDDHEKRIVLIEEQLKKMFENPQRLINTQDNFLFSDKKKNHNKLLEELLKSDFCHSKNGLPFEEIMEIFSLNNKAVNPKKLRDLLSIWKNRKKIDSIKSGGKLKYWMENGR